jgi:hypothetical protein
VQHTLRKQHASKTQHRQPAIPVFSQGNPGQAAKGVDKTLLARVAPAVNSSSSIFGSANFAIAFTPVTAIPVVALPCTLASA